MLLKKIALAALAALALASAAVAADKKNPVVVLDTTKGAIEIELYADKAPVTVKNFLEYVKKGHYDGTIFHRVIPGFMIQGGGFSKDMEQKPTSDPIKNEADNGVKNDRGTIAMARTSDPNSATAQFFINVVDNEGLNRPKPDGHGYAVFGKVVKGLDVADAIVKVPTTSRGGHQNVPEEPIVVKSAKLKGAAAKEESAK
jgi:peptidyl-prolyl cis-trans isomerase A (cyclophilin A)